MTSFGLLIFEKCVNVPSKITVISRKLFFQNNFFVGVLKVNDEKSRIRIQIHTKLSWIWNTDQKVSYSCLDHILVRGVRERQFRGVYRGKPEHAEPQRHPRPGLHIRREVRFQGDQNRTGSSFCPCFEVNLGGGKCGIPVPIHHVCRKM